MAKAWSMEPMPYEWGKICEAIGVVDPSRVKGITINLPDDGPVIITVELWLTQGMVRHIWPIPSGGDNGDETP